MADKKIKKSDPPAVFLKWSNSRGGGVNLKIKGNGQILSDYQLSRIIANVGIKRGSLDTSVFERCKNLPEGWRVQGYPSGIFVGPDQNGLLRRVG